MSFRQLDAARAVASAAVLIACSGSTSNMASDAAAGTGAAVAGSGGVSSGGGTSSGGTSSGGSLTGCAGACPTPDAAAACNDLSDSDAPAVVPKCPTGACTACDTGGNLGDGTYVMTSSTVWESACGSLAFTDTRARLVVAGSTLDLVSSQPVGFGQTATTTSTYHFDVSFDANVLVLHQACPAVEPGYDVIRVPYAVAGPSLTVGQFPGLIGVTEFQLQGP